MTSPPEYLLPRPVMPDDPAVLAAFDRLFDAAVNRGPGGVIEYDLPLWPMYFAILDRANHSMSTINAGLRWVRPGGEVSDPYYFFSITPFLDQIRGHDDESTFARARADPDGFPWLDPTTG